MKKIFSVVLVALVGLFLNACNGSKNKKNNNKTRNNNNKNFDSKPKKVVEEVHAITYTDGITVGELAEKIAHPSTDIIKT